MSETEPSRQENAEYRHLCFIHEYTVEKGQEKREPDRIGRDRKGKVRGREACREEARGRGWM